MLPYGLMSNSEHIQRNLHLFDQGAAMSEISTTEYAEFLVDIKSRIRQRQYQAFRAVNTEMVALYWEIGESIDRKQQKLGWGKAVVETLARDLQAEFPDRNGFSARNLWNMRDFYLAYAEHSKLQPLVAEISWAKNLVIFTRCKDELEREFYLRATARFGWTKAVLQHQVDNKSYEKYLLNQTNFDKTLSPELQAQALLAVKDTYTFEATSTALKLEGRSTLLTSCSFIADCALL